MTHKMLTKIILMIQAPAGYRLDFWNSFKTNIFSELIPMPWMNYGAIIHIQNLLRPDACLFEYGSGSSTRYWIAKGCKVVSVEHDKTFFEKMKTSLADFCDYKLIEPELDQAMKGKLHELPESYKSSDYDELSFEAYVKAIDEYPDYYFDLVVVDGRARSACIKHAVPKIKRGGVLILDNSDRDYYLKNTKWMLNGWNQTTYRGVVRGLLHKEQTTIFQKP